MNSIEEKGLLEPVVVRPVQEGFEVVAGNRRLEACRKLRWRTMTCHVVELTDRESLEVSIIENVQRETLNPIDEATALKKYVDEFGYGSVSELAAKIGKSEAYVSRRIQLLELPKAVRAEVMRRRITPSVAQELIPLEDRDANEAVEVIREQHLSLREVRRIVKNHRSPQNGETFSTFDISPPSDAFEKRKRAADRALARALASLRMDFSRLGEVIDGLDNEEWIVREMLIQCRINLNEQMENLFRFRKKFAQRAVESPSS